MAGDFSLKLIFLQSLRPVALLLIILWLVYGLSKGRRTFSFRLWIAGSILIWIGTSIIRWSVFLSG